MGCTGHKARAASAGRTPDEAVSLNTCLVLVKTYIRVQCRHANIDTGLTLQIPIGAANLFAGQCALMTGSRRSSTDTQLVELMEPQLIVRLLMPMSDIGQAF